MLAGALGAVFSESVSIPFDTAKVTMFVQVGKSSDYNSVFGTMRKISHDKGITKLWAGLNAAYLRAFIFHGLKLPIYENFKYFVCTKEEITNTPFVKKMFAGIASGAIAIIFATPAEVIKVKM